MGLGNIALIGDIRSVGSARVGGNGGVRENIAKQCVMSHNTHVTLLTNLG